MAILCLCAAAVRPSIRLPLCRSFTSSAPPLLNRFKISCSITSPPSSVTMLAPSFFTTAKSQTVEHIVLFKVKPDIDPSKVDAMIDGLNGLTSLDQVLHLTAGPVLRSRSSALSFTHLLHSRYKSKSDLADYSDHPRHVGVVTKFVRPTIDDVMALDWVSNDLTGPLKPKPGSAVRITFLKLKENTQEDDRSRILQMIGEMKSKIPTIEQMSVGENFSAGRDKGFSICSLAVFPSRKELETLDSDSYSELVNDQKQKVRDLLDGVVVIDYVVPLPQIQLASTL